MDKYLVFRLERPFGSDLNVTESCFELVKEFDMAEGGHTWAVATTWAENYSKDHNLRTIVIKGSVFG